MNTVVVRYSEIGSKSGGVRSKMRQALRQRVNNRLEHENIEFSKVSESPGRLIIRETDREAAEIAAETPGVASTSLCIKTESNIESMKETVQQLDVGDTFGIDTNRSGQHSFDSQDVAEELGAFVEEETGASVDLDDPDTWIGVDVREDETYIFTERIEGVGGLPVGVESELAALVSGGIDSPVAAFEVMRRGSSILPIYFYNKPLAAEDHLMRFEQTVEELKKFHPSKKWFYYIIDMEEVNQLLMEEVGKGRMVLHRALMFRVAEKLSEEEGLKGLVTGEAIGQKSSQTPMNLYNTSSELDLPVHRPLLTRDKSSIVESAKEIDTFEYSKIDSACRSISPDNPSTELKSDRFEELKNRIEFEELVEKLFSEAEKVRI